MKQSIVTLNALQHTWVTLQMWPLHWQTDIKPVTVTLPAVPIVQLMQAYIKEENSVLVSMFNHSDNDIVLYSEVAVLSLYLNTFQKL